MKTRRGFCFTAVVCLFGLAMTSMVYFGHSKEMEVTKEWQLVGENDTIPAGMHIRMDMTTGEKWVKQLDDEEDDGNSDQKSASKAATAVVNGDGSLQIIEQEEKEEGEATTTEDKANYHYEMMHRTLSQLPEEEIERMGGIPELPQTKGSSSSTLTTKEREAFEKRMSEIWERRQAELKEMEEHTVDLPEVLKERILSIKGYLADPLSHLKSINLDNDNDADNDTPTHFVSILEDLEFLLTDIDMTRDFHTLGGWTVLVSLLSEESHVQQNMTISALSPQLEANARAVQAHAAWAIGTAVKNTGEFSPLAIEIVPTRNGGTTTAIDLLADVLCNSENKDADAVATRNLLSKSVYAIGSLLRGNRIAQVHTSKTDTPKRLGEKLRELTIARFSSSTTKLVHRLVSLAGDIVSDVNLHSEGLDDDTKREIIASYTSQDWCDSLSTLLTTDTFLPANVQETLLESVTVLKPYCDWESQAADFKKAISTMQGEWENNRDGYDHDHLEHLTELAKRAYESFEEKQA